MKHSDIIDSDDETQFYLSSDEESDDEFPYELDYFVRKKDMHDYIDVDKIHYNDHFKRRGVDHILSKMPTGSGENIPGWKQVLELFADNISDSPLEELINLSVDNIYDREDTTISEF